MKERTCKICGESFLPRSNQQRYCKNQHYKPCPVCGVLVPVSNDRWNEPPHACSTTCKLKLTEATCLERYGVAAPGSIETNKEKFRQTCLKRYGTTSPLLNPEIAKKSVKTLQARYGADNAMRCEEIRQRAVQTNLSRYGSSTYLTSQEGKSRIAEIIMERYGVSHPCQSEEILEKRSKTNLERYGATNPLASPEVQEKSKQTCLAHYGVEHPMMSEEIKQRQSASVLRKYGVSNPSKAAEVLERIHNKMLEKYGTSGVLNVPEIREKIVATNLRKYGVPYYVMLPQVAKSSGRVSKTNEKFAELLTKFKIAHIKEFCIGKYSYDFFLPGLNLLIEINPSYTHSLVATHWESKVSQDYHINKSQLAWNHGYDCIHLFDWDDTAKWVASLQPKTFVRRSECEVKICQYEEVRRFLSKYSLLNTYTPAHKFVVMVHQGRVLQCLVIRENGVTCVIEEDVVHHNYQIHLGLYNLVAHLRKSSKYTEILFCVDLSKSTGSRLCRLPFLPISTLGPQIIWSKNRSAIADADLEHRTADPLDNFIMLEEKYLPVPNCGYQYFKLY